MTDESIAFIEKVRSMCKEEGDCWIWGGATNPSGVPVIRSGRSNQSVRRLAYVAATGEVLTPRDHVRAKCGDKKCVCPDHAFVQDVAAARKAQGKAGQYSTVTMRISRAQSARKRAKLTHADHDAIRASDATQDGLAAQYGVHRSYISAIQRGAVSFAYPNPFAGLFTSLAANDSTRRRA